MITNLIQAEELDGHIYVSVDELHKRDEEVERLTKRLEEAQLAYLAVEEKNKKLHSIIKEVKEYIEEHIEWEVDGEEGVDYTAWINFKGTSYEYFVKDLLEILDKENK